jgi:outer membrane receptor protein involved in Fe transport
VVSPPGTQVTINRGTVTAQGIELEGRGTPVKILDFSAGFTYEWQQQTNALGMPLTELKLGVTVTPIESLHFSLYDLYFARFGEISSTLTHANPPVRSFHDVSFNIEYKASKHFVFNFAGKNIFSSPVYYPEILEQKVNSTPGRSGIAIYGGVTATL